MISKSDWIKHFPFPTPRPEQEIAINEILNKFESGKKFVVCSAPPGTGKSAIAVCVSKYLQSKNYKYQNKTSYIVTTQIILQDQYVNDFPYIPSISAKQNYTCKFRSMGINCDMGLTIANAMSKIGGKFSLENYKDKCCYEVAKKSFYDNDISLTNLPFFIAHSSDKDMINRELLVIDEAHNIENVITDFASININKFFVEEILKMNWKMILTNASSEDNLIQYLQSKLLPVIISTYDKYYSKVNSSKTSDLETPSGLSSIKKLNDIKKILENITYLSKNQNNSEWILTISESEDEITLKPIFADKFAEDLLFSKSNKVLMMSGTILNFSTFCKMNGIDEKNASFVYMDSPFPVENRMIYKVNIGSMSRKNIEETTPKMIEAIKYILDQHKNDKGIIHCVNYQIAFNINQQILDDRLLFHSSTDRREILEFHLSTKSPTVLVSPSFNEGINLIDDASRFQIIAKCPYPSLGDNYVKTKMNRIKEWYPWQTAKTLIQSTGRSVRHKEDYCVTYILDTDVEMLLKMNGHLFPKWWTDSIRNI